MKKVKLGTTDLEVSQINLGGNVFGWTLKAEQSNEILDAFLDGGFNFIDTADMYGGWWANGEFGLSEIIIGNWMKQRGNREQLVIATKGGGESNLHPTDVSKKHILKSIDASLERLKTDYIDLYYTHIDDGVTPVEETLSAYDEAIKAGKIHYIGTSNMSPERIMASMKASEKFNLPRYVALQQQYNLMERQGYEALYAPLVEEFNLASLSYYSLASGFLTGKYRSEADLKGDRAINVSPYLNEKGLSVLRALDKIADKHQTGQSSVAIGWLLTRPSLVSAVASATSQNQLKGLFDAARLTLDSEDLELLNQVSGPVHVVPNQYQSRLGKEM